MDHDELRHHIRTVTDRPEDRMTGLTYRIVSACWPGGLQDRTDVAALGWLRRWRPESIGAELPPCGCASGRCTICN